MHAIRRRVAEEALERLLREVLHVQPGPYEFAETVYVSGNGANYIVNVFTCVEWAGDPRYAERLYSDAAWAQPGAPGELAVQPDVRAFLFGAFAGEEDASAVEVVATRTPRTRSQPLASSWSTPTTRSRRSGASARLEEVVTPRRACARRFVRGVHDPRGAPSCSAPATWRDFSLGPVGGRPPHRAPPRTLVGACTP
ncbi:MAG: hypothetical protein U0360_04035 [Dehalococcoidia bacterium]